LSVLFFSVYLEKEDKEKEDLQKKDKEKEVKEKEGNKKEDNEKKDDEKEDDEKENGQKEDYEKEKDKKTLITLQPWMGARHFVGVAAIFRTPLRQAPTRLFTAKCSVNVLLAPTRQAPKKESFFCGQKFLSKFFSSKLLCLKTDIVANF